MRTGISVGINPMKLATIICMSYGNIGETKGWMGLAQAAINNSIKTIFLPVVTA
jgi:hypothetical protein